MEQRTPPNAIDRAKFDIHPDVDARFTKRVLTPRDRRMVSAYVREGTYAAAARASGYAMATVKKKITSDGGIRKAIGEIVDQAAILTGVTLERVLQEYARLAFVDMGELVEVMENASDPEAALVAFGNLPQDITAAISEVNVEMSKGSEDGPPVGKLKLKLYDKKSALQDLGRMLSVFSDRVIIEDNTGFGDRLSRAIKKIEGMKDGSDEEETS